MPTFLRHILSFRHGIMLKTAANFARYANDLPQLLGKLKAFSLRDHPDRASSVSAGRELAKVSTDRLRVPGPNYTTKCSQRLVPFRLT